MTVDGTNVVFDPASVVVAWAFACVALTGGLVTPTWCRELLDGLSMWITYICKPLSRLYIVVKDGAYGEILVHRDLGQ